MFRRRLFWFTLLAAALASPFLFSIAQDLRGGSEVHWRQDYNSARKEALEKKLPIVLDFGTDNCVWCDHLDRTTFRDPKVVNLMNDKFIPVKINADRESFLTQRLRISRFPTLVFASAEGKILDTKEGYQDAIKFHDALQRVLVSTGEPDWMQRDFQLAEKAIKGNEPARAVTLLKTIVEDGNSRPTQIAAQKLLDELETKGQEQLTLAKELMDKGQANDALTKMSDVIGRFAGLKVSRDAGELITKVAQSPELRRQQRSKKAQELLAQAQDFYKFKDYLPCLDRCEILMASYGDLAEGLEASNLSSVIKNDPEWLQNAVDVLGERLGSLNLALAESFLRRGQTDRAKFHLERVVRSFPGTRYAESAQIRLAQLSGVQPGRVEVKGDAITVRTPQP